MDIIWHWRWLTFSSHWTAGWDCCLMFNENVAVLWQQAGTSMLLGVAFTATSSKQTAEMHRSKPHTGRRSEGRGGEGDWEAKDSARGRDNTQHSVGETPFLPLLLLTHPWHGRNVQIKETCEVRMWEGKGTDIGRTEKCCAHIAARNTLPLQSALWDVSQMQC